MLQIGADIYCDTALMARRLEAEKASPALFPIGMEFVTASFAAWADSVVFQTAVALMFQPASLAERFAGAPEAMVKAFVADRAALFTGGTASRVNLAQAKSQWPVWMARIEQQLQAGEGEFLFGPPSIADFALAHPLWFLMSGRQTAPYVEVYPGVAAWLQRVRDLGHGSFSDMSAAEAIWA